MALSLAGILAESALRNPAGTAVVCGDERISYAELWEQTRRYAAVLRDRGVGPGTRVALLAPNVPDFPRVYYAVLALGGVVVPVHALLTADEIGYVLTDSQAGLLVCAGPLVPEGVKAAQATGVPALSVLAPDSVEAPSLTALAATAEPVPDLVEREPGDEAVILYTSGTTGSPKGAVLTQLNMLLNATISSTDLVRIGRDDVVLGCLPLFHSFGQTSAMNACFHAGGTLVLVPRFDGPGALDLMVAEQVTIFLGVPTMYVALLAAAENDPRRPRLRHAVSGGASLPLTVLEKFEQVFGGAIYEGYGLSETSPVATFNQEVFGRKPGSVGRAIWGVRVAVADPDVTDRVVRLPTGEVGEILIRGHNVFAGYLNRPEATAEVMVDGWFRSGDLGYADADGFVFIVDRKKDMVLRGGYNVYPREVEEVLLRHPAVAQVAVIGVPHETHGEEVCAVIVPAAGQPADADAIREWSKEHLARYKYPRIIRFVDALPLGPSGKVLKRELRAQA